MTEAARGLYCESIRLNAGTLYNEIRRSVFQSQTEECPSEVKLRVQITAIEKKVKAAGTDGVYPPWLTQNRDWQTVDAHIRQSKFIDLGNNCNSG